MTAPAPRRTGFTALALLAAACAGPQASRPALQSDGPPPLALPAGEETALRLSARGTQNYECRPASGGGAWALVAPEAELFDASGHKVGRHYAGPTWESSVDGSRVKAAVKAHADAPEPGAVPWLLLTATETSGEGLFGQVKSVQRTDTHGGQPPAGPCAPGDTVKVPYSAVYWFSRARP